ncbi:MAG TPA: helix-turn-helix transcriptional regulator [Anaerolineae bacterium]|nr:helix-turn-helix transcriptional regulator [Anaerolineae bacterium]
MTLGPTLRQLREERGWSQGQLALRSGIDQSHLSKIERDVHETINARVLARIADALNVTTDYLMEAAGWKHPLPSLGVLMPREQRLIDTIRQIRAHHTRREALDQLIWMAQALVDAERGHELKKAAEAQEAYREGS